MCAILVNILVRVDYILGIILGTINSTTIIYISLIYSRKLFINVINTAQLSWKSGVKKVVFTAQMN